MTEAAATVTRVTEAAAMTELTGIAGLPGFSR